ncbi:DUF1214 domain-containing protein [Actinophytocola sp.]|uniref:DUF1214 domain-containing protein n=1 Tax=Actinophytocola sp. TaxID=1872138 RepID=UPI003C724C52
MFQAAAQELHAGVNQIVYWSGLLDWRNQTLTPNPNAVYLMPFLNTANGPVVLEIPPAGGGTIIGTVMDGWQVPLEDVGEAGVDKGAGGKYLVLPPGYEGQVPDGYIPLPSQTNAGYALLRSSVASGADSDVAAAVEYGKQIKLYPLAQADNPPPTTFLDAAGVSFDATINYDLSFFETLDVFIQAEPWLERDKVMIDMLRSIGIEKGKPFAPDDALKQVLNEAIDEAHAWLDAQYERFFTAPFFDDAHWALPASTELVKAASLGYEEPDSYPIDSRAGAYYWAFSGIKHMGVGQFYLMSTRDSHGDPLDGARNYRLHVPPNPPVKLYWSATGYDRHTHALIRDVAWASRASTTPGLHTNPDGSVDLHIGPEPAGDDANWLPTSADRPFEVLVRFFGPEPALFDKTWHLPDIERID